MLMVIWDLFNIIKKSENQKNNQKKANKMLALGKVY